MQGTEIKLFPVVIRCYDIDGHAELTDELIPFFKESPYQMQSNIPEGVITSRPNLHRLENNALKLLHQHFCDALEEYRQTYLLCCDRLDITLSWFNYAPARSGFGHPLHRHPMSYLSAVYYLTEGAPTIFEDPCTPRTSDCLDIWRKDLMESDLGINEKIDAKPGRLIIFPSWLKHYSGRQLEDYDRWSISFNAMPWGRINIGPYGEPQLCISQVSADEIESL